MECRFNHDKVIQLSTHSNRILNSTRSQINLGFIPKTFFLHENVFFFSPSHPKFYRSTAGEIWWESLSQTILKFPTIRPEMTLERDCVAVSENTGQTVENFNMVCEEDGLPNILRNQSAITFLRNLHCPSQKCFFGKTSSLEEQIYFGVNHICT